MYTTVTIKKSLAMLTVIAGVFLFGNLASANYTVLTQPNNLTNTNTREYFQQNFASTTGTAQYITIYEKTTTNKNIHIDLSCRTGSSSCTPGSTLASATASSSNTFTFLTVELNTPIHLTSDNVYSIDIYASNNIDDVQLTGSATDNLSNSHCISIGASEGQKDPCDLVADLYFRISTDNTPASKSISIILPQNLFYGADFPYWNIQWVDTQNPTTTHTMYINYGNGAYTYQDALSRTGLSDLNSFAVPKLTPLPTNAYQAYALLVDQNDTVVATSSTIYFTINTTSSTTFIDDYMNSFATSSPTKENRCDAGSNDTSWLSFQGLQRGICNAFTFLFVPSNTAVNNFYAIPGLMESKAPFSYLTDMSLLIHEVTTPNQSSSTISQEFSISGGVYGSYSTDTTQTIIPDLNSQFGSDSTVLAIRSWLVKILYLTFAIIIFFFFVKKFS